MHVGGQQIAVVKQNGRIDGHVSQETVNAGLGLVKHAAQGPAVDGAVAQQVAIVLGVRTLGQGQVELVCGKEALELALNVGAGVPGLGQDKVQGGDRVDKGVLQQVGHGGRTKAVAPGAPEARRQCIAGTVVQQLLRALRADAGVGCGRDRLQAHLHALRVMEHLHAAAGRAAPALALAHADLVAVIEELAAVRRPGCCLLPRRVIGLVARQRARTPRCGPLGAQRRLGAHHGVAAAVAILVSVNHLFFTCINVKKIVKKIKRERKRKRKRKRKGEGGTNK